ncbi:unnamed protein product [Coffea canephora]|uniref:Uncharacterized protein n=1 Tax=Coffea canephora TaxID=49390 RepID=A0A068V960_COFCA|nr:unnamed protein product [Coffea canephora]
MKGLTYGDLQAVVPDSAEEVAMGSDEAAMTDNSSIVYGAGGDLSSRREPLFYTAQSFLFLLRSAEAFLSKPPPFDFSCSFLCSVFNQNLSRPSLFSFLLPAFSPHFHFLAFLSRFLFSHHKLAIAFSFLLFFVFSFLLCRTPHAQNVAAAFFSFFFFSAP